MKATAELLEKAGRGEVDLVSLMLEDLELYAHVALKIQTKGGKIIPFAFNEPQRIMHEWCEAQMAERGRIRAVLLKARQFGGSTYVAGRLFHKTSTRRNQHAKVIAHKSVAASDLLKMYRRFYDKLPEVLRPQTKYHSKQELTFDNPSRDAAERRANPGLESSLGVYSAGSDGVGRGTTQQGLHCSEVAFWDEAEAVMLALLNTVPSSEEEGAGTEVFLESTANGMGNYFHKTYMQAKRGEGDFRALFIPWYVHPEYRAKAPVDFQKTLNKLERDLYEKEHEDWDYVSPGTGAKRLSLDQLFWRRVTLATLCNNDVRKFQQEYPLTDEEAFITSGSAFFDPEDVRDRLNEVMSSVKYEFRGELEYVSKSAEKGRKKQEPVLNEDELTGNLRIWAKPEEKTGYVFFADVAEGVDGGDFSVIQILRRRDGYQCAEWRGYVDPDALAQIIYDLGRYYNWAYGAPESQGHGLVTLMRLKELGYPYIYTRQVYDQTTNNFRQSEGWLTTLRTRPVMLEALRSAFRDGEVIINSVDVLSEMQTFSLIRGKVQAQEGCHDDALMALAGACQMLEELPDNSKAKVKNWVAQAESRKVKSGRRGVVRRDRYTGAII